MFQEITLIGRIGLIKDLKETPNWTAITFTVATHKYFTKEIEGESKRVKETTWWTCTAWGGLAKAFAQYKKVGEVVHLKGELKFNEKDGKRYANVRVHSINYLPSYSKPSEAQVEEPAIKTPNEIDLSNPEFIAQLKAILANA